MRFAKPSGKIIAFAILVAFFVFVVIGFNLYAEKIGEKEKDNSEDTLISGFSVRDNFPTNSTDSDKDGLDDWEEKIWRTDPFNPDTDGDGTPDGEEVDNKRNPRSPLDNDRLTFSEIEIFNKKYEEEAQNVANLNTTEALNNLVFGGINLQSFQELSPSAQEEILRTKVSDARKTVQFIEPYTMFDLIVLDNPTNEQYANYGNEFAEKLLFVYLGLVENDENLDLFKIIENYQDVASDLIKIAVPEDFIDDHLIVANGLNKVAQTFSSMLDYQNDPARALLASQEMTVVQEEVTSVLIKYDEFFRENDIIFNEEDLGSALWN